MRVALVSDILPGNIGGVERFTVSMAAELRKHNIEVDVYDRSAIANWQEKWYDKYLMHQRRNWRLGAAVWQKINSSHFLVPDVIMQNSIAGWNLRSKTNIPRIVIHHGTMRGLYHIKLPADISWRMKLNRYIGLVSLKGKVEQYSACGAVSVAVSTAVAEELKQYYKDIEPIVIPNGIDTNHFSPQERNYCRQKYGIAQDEFAVCFTARFGVLGKGFEEVYALAVLARQEQVKLKFIIATDEIPQGWPANVIFLKNVSYQELPALYSAADVFLFPTRYEGCSYSLLEAMACGLPVLTTKVGYAHDLYREISEFKPYIFAQNNVGEYWRVLKQLMNDQLLRHRLGAVGVEYVRRHNSLEAMIIAYLQLLTEKNVK